MDRTPRGNPNLPRSGGSGFKRNGFLGQIPVDGDVATEYSIGVPIFGRETEIPSIVPTLSRGELEQVKRSIASGETIPDSIRRLAIAHAQIRLASGQSPFAGDNESPTPTRHAGPWSDEYVYGDAQPSAVLNDTLRKMSAGDAVEALRKKQKK